MAKPLSEKLKKLGEKHPLAWLGVKLPANNLYYRLVT